jgi:hypothetical protein
MGMTLTSGLACRVEMNRLGRMRKFAPSMRALTSDGGEMQSPEAVPVGQRFRLSFDCASGEAFDAISVNCQAEGIDAYRVNLRLVAGTWPYQLYSKLASQGATRSSGPTTPSCLRDLELRTGCSIDDVEAAFARLVRRCHPDRGGSVDEFVRVRRAYLDSLALLGGHR